MKEKHRTGVQLSEEEILASLRRQIEVETPDILDQLMKQIRPAETGKQNGAFKEIGEIDRQNLTHGGAETHESEGQRAIVLKQSDRGGRKRRRGMFAALAGIAAMLAVCFGVFFHAGQTASIIQIDVNPSVEMSVDRKDRVVEAHALNADGERVLEGMKLKKVDANVAVNAIIGSMVKQGYFSTSQSAVLVTVINKDPQKSQALGQKIVSDINQTFTSQNRQVRIYNQGLVSGENVKKQAKQYGISQGKMAFIDKLIQQDGSLSREQLSQMSITQLERVIVNQNLDLSGMAEYDEDDSLSENIEEIIEEIDVNPSKQGQTVHKKSDQDSDEDEDDEDNNNDGSSLKQQVNPSHKAPSQTVDQKKHDGGHEDEEDD